jgi:MFS family permease
MEEMTKPDSRTVKTVTSKALAYQFIVLMGIVSLFGDITYEGARSVSGPFLATLGASAAMVGLVAGLGEFFGYALRLLTGWLADRTRAYWPLTILGYGLILAVPMLAFAGNLQLAAFFLILERVGKAVRSPARDALLSHATKQVGRGWGFALHEALDQIGAIAGPLLFTAVFLFHGRYADGFRWLWVPGLLTLAILLFLRWRIPETAHLEAKASPRSGGRTGPLPRAFWTYTLFLVLTVAGFAAFPLLAYHFKTQGVFGDVYIPLLYAGAMAVDGIVALIIGRVYDRVGLKALLIVPVLTVPIPWLAFSSSTGGAIASILLWGAVMGIHETIMRAAVADLTPIERRGTAYGVFNTAYGLSWLVGSVLLGWLYQVALPLVIVGVILLQIAALAVGLGLQGKTASAAAS